MRTSATNPTNHSDFPGDEPSCPLGLDHYDALFVLCYSFIQHRQTDKAMTVLEALQVLLPANPHIQHSLSYLYLISRRYQAALELVDRCADKRQPLDPALALLRGRALWGLERYQEARDQLTCIHQREDSHL